MHDDLINSYFFYSITSLYNSRICLQNGGLSRMCTQNFDGDSCFFPIVFGYKT